MHRRVFFIALMLLGLANTGCLLNIWSSDPNTSMAEDIRQIDEHEWRTIWFKDQPDQQTPVRVHGGLGQ